MMNNKILLLLTTSIISACSLAPKFILPKMDLPKEFKEQPKKEVEIDGVLWKAAETLEKKDRGQWWKIFGDQELNELESKAIEANQTLKSAASHVEQSRDISDALKGGLFPTIDIGANAVRAKSSNSSLAAFGTTSSTNLKPYTLYSGQGVISYEADLFGRARNTYKASSLDADAEAALYKSTMLALQADVATNYFALRSLDSELKLLETNVKIRSEAARIMQKRYKEGEAGEQDFARTKSELASVEADFIALKRQRSKTEHALAVLLGKIPSEFSFAQSPLENTAPPPIPGGLPSALLERRPDIAAAIDSMQAANARIGVAKAAFFPSLNLTASGGFGSTSLSNIFNTSGQSWALGQTAGNALSLPIFHGGENVANLKAAKAGYDETVANYRQQVLVAFRDVEDNLTDQQMLAEQSVKQNQAAEAAIKTTSLAKKRYHEGETDYFEVVDSERISLAAERSDVQLRGQRFLSTIALIRALGGGWDDDLKAK